MERNQNTLQEAIEKAVDFLKNRNDDINRTSPHCKYQSVSTSQPVSVYPWFLDWQNDSTTTHDINPMINLNRQSTGAYDYTQATVLSKDQLDWLIVGGSYLFFAIIW